MTEVARLQTAKLGTLAERINAEHRACESAVAATLLHAIRCGELLMEAKAGVAHGSWLPWLAANFEGSESTAQVYMKLARNKDVLIEANTQRAPFSSIRTALVAIAPSHPMPTVPHTAGLVSDEERQRRAALAAERKGQRLAERAEYAIRSGNTEPPAGIWHARWEYALAEAVHLRGQNLPNVVDALAHQLDILVEHAPPEEVGKYLTEYQTPWRNDPDEAENRSAMLAELRAGIAWLQRVLEEADWQQRQIERYEEADKVGEQLRMQNPE